MDIHPTAVLHPSLGPPQDLTVGAYAVIENGVRLGPGVRIGPFCHLYPGCDLGAGVRLEDGVSLGNVPQDLKFRGEVTGVRVETGAWLREYVTVNRGTSASGITRIGAGSLIMAYAHVAHDCDIGERAVVANGVQMGGHVRIGKGAVVSGMTGIHQFVSIGAGAFVGGNLRVDKDVLPYSKALGDPLRFAGLNTLGLERSGFTPAAGAWLRGYYRKLRENGAPATASGSSEAGPSVSGLSEAGERWEPGLTGIGADPERLLLAETVRDFFARRRRGLLLRLPG